jgi:ornithine cyclodeaminase
MGAIWEAQGVAGHKVYSTAEGKFSFVVVLFDTIRNRPLAVIDGAALTRFRTAAITALVASKAASPEPRKLALLGAGEQGRAQVEALCDVFSLTTIHIVDPKPQRAWCERLAHDGCVAVAQVSAADAVHDADIVVTATRSALPVLEGDWLKPGCFESAVGTSSATGRELDDRTMRRARRVIVEWRPQSLREAGEIVLWKDDRDLDKVVDLPQLYRGEIPWRSDADAITVFKTVGIGLSDVAVGHAVLARLGARPGGPAQESGA